MEGLQCLRCEAMERTESVILTVCEEEGAGGDCECEEDRQFGWQGNHIHRLNGVNYNSRIWANFVFG